MPDDKYPRGWWTTPEAPLSRGQVEVEHARAIAHARALLPSDDTYAYYRARPREVELDPPDVGSTEWCLAQRMARYDIDNNAYPITLPGWAIRRILRCQVRQLWVPIESGNSEASRGASFDDFEFSQARVMVGPHVPLHRPGPMPRTTYLQSGSVDLRPGWDSHKALWVREWFKTERVMCDRWVVSDEDREGFDRFRRGSHHEFVREDSEDDDYADDDPCDDHCDQTYVYYRATPREGYRAKPDGASITYLVQSSPLTDFHVTGFRCPGEMDRDFSRIVMPIRIKRVERVQDMRHEDPDSCIFTTATDTPYLPGPLEDLIELWDRDRRPGLKWSDNPWCWVVDEIYAVAYNKLAVPRYASQGKRRTP